MIHSRTFEIEIGMEEHEFGADGLVVDVNVRLNIVYNVLSIEYYSEVHSPMS